MQQGQTTRKSPSFKGMWHLKRKPHGGVIAIGNALGNSIVSKLSGTSSPQQAEKKAKAAAQQAVLNGASPQEAKAIELQTYARESGGTIEAVSQSSGKALHGSFAYDSDDGFWLSNGTERVRLGWDASMTDVSDFLGNSAARDLGMQYASSRLVAKQARDNAFYDGVVSGIYNVHQATAQRNASFNGFRGDLMTREDWGYTIANQTRQWSQQNATSAMMFVAGVASVPLLAADLIAVGALAGRGAMALGRGVMNTADDMGRSLYASYQATGIRGTLLSAASPTTSWATVQSASLTAMRGMSSAAPGSAELALTQFARTTTGYSAQLGKAAWSGATNLASRIGLTRLPLASADFVSGGISGSVNVAFEYAKNPSKSALDYSADFATGFAGGVVGNRVATGMKNMLLVGAHSSVARSNALIKSEIIGGFVSGSVSNYISQSYNVWQKPQENSFDRSKFIEATLFSGFVGGGVAKNWPNLAPNTQFAINANFGSVLQNWQDFYDRYFGSSGQ